MPPRASRRSQRGLLLVEAVLSTVVIAVGLVLISRALSGQLKAIHTVEEYDTLLALAQGKLLELEELRCADQPLLETHEGAFQEPYAAYHWALTAKKRSDSLDANGQPLTSTVTISAGRTNPPSGSVQLSAIWPFDWVPNAWY